MPYATKEAKRAYERRKRLAQRILGLCRDCPNPSTHAVLCSFCRAKQYARHPETVEARRVAARPDRRWNRQACKVLDWMLQERIA